MSRFTAKGGARLRLMIALTGTATIVAGVFAAHGLTAKAPFACNVTQIAPVSPPQGTIDTTNGNSATLTYRITGNLNDVCTVTTDDTNGWVNGSTFFNGTNNVLTITSGTTKDFTLSIPQHYATSLAGNRLMVNGQSYGQKSMYMTLSPSTIHVGTGTPSDRNVVLTIFGPKNTGFNSYGVSFAAPSKWTNTVSSLTISSDGSGPTPGQVSTTGSQIQAAFNNTSDSTDTLTVTYGDDSSVTSAIESLLHN